MGAPNDNPPSPNRARLERAIARAMTLVDQSADEAEQSLESAGARLFPHYVRTLRQTITVDEQLARRDHETATKTLVTRFRHERIALNRKRRAKNEIHHRLAAAGKHTHRSERYDAEAFADDIEDRLADADMDELLDIADYNRIVHILCQEFDVTEAPRKDENDEDNEPEDDEDEDDEEDDPAEYNEFERAKAAKAAMTPEQKAEYDRVWDKVWAEYRALPPLPAVGVYPKPPVYTTELLDALFAAGEAAEAAKKAPDDPEAAKKALDTAEAAGKAFEAAKPKPDD